MKKDDLVVERDGLAVVNTSLMGHNSELILEKDDLVVERQALTLANTGLVNHNTQLVVRRDVLHSTLIQDPARLISIFGGDPVRFVEGSATREQYPELGTTSRRLYDVCGAAVVHQV
jgi:hypothetical protein